MATIPPFAGFPQKTENVSYQQPSQQQPPFAYTTNATMQSSSGFQPVGNYNANSMRTSTVPPIAQPVPVSSERPELSGMRPLATFPPVPMQQVSGPSAFTAPTTSALMCPTPPPNSVPYPAQNAVPYPGVSSAMPRPPSQISQISQGGMMPPGAFPDNRQTMGGGMPPQPQQTFSAAMNSQMNSQFPGMPPNPSGHSYTPTPPPTQSFPQPPYPGPGPGSKYPNASASHINAPLPPPPSSAYESRMPSMNGPSGMMPPPMQQHASNMPPPPSYQQQQQHNHNLNGNYQSATPVNQMSQQFAQMGMPGERADSRYVDLMQDRNFSMDDDNEGVIELPPTVCNQYAHCSPSVFRCTFRAVPQTQDMMKKSRLPFGLTLQPFRSMKHLPVINTSSIVRCRYCRTYINPYVYFPDTRHWKCNLCYRVNDLPDDFAYDPKEKKYAEPSRRPEIQNATVEFIAPSEYMLRPPQPAVYVFVLDVSQAAVESGYLDILKEQLCMTLDHLPGDKKTSIAFIGVDSALHFFQFTDKQPPKQLIVDDYENPFLPVGQGLLVNLKDNLETVRTFVQNIPTIFESNSSSCNCLGAALNIAHGLIEDLGGRITVLQAVLPNLGPGALVSREDPNQRASAEVQNMGPANDFYKNLALECTGHQIAIDLFLLNTHYADLATLSEASKFTTGCVYHYSGYHTTRNAIQVKRFEKQLNRYLTRKIGFEAVLRIRCTRGLTLHTFYGNFFVRSTDLLQMANINPDSAFGVQVQMEEDLTGLNCVCFQAALLYSSSIGERRIRVHTLCLPVTKSVPALFARFDTRCAVSLLSKMAVERSMAGGSLTDSREAMINSVVDAFGSHNIICGQTRAGSLLSPNSSMRFFPIYVLGMLKHMAFSLGISVKLDERVAALLQFKTAPLEIIELELFPALYKLNNLIEEEVPPRLHLSYEKVDVDGIYAMDTGSYVYIYVRQAVPPALLNALFGVDLFAKLDEEYGIRPDENSEFGKRVEGLLRQLSQARGALFAPVVVIKEGGLNSEMFTRRLIEDRTESSLSYIEFLQHIRQDMQR